MKKQLSIVLFVVFHAVVATAQSNNKPWHNFNSLNSGLAANVIQALATNNSDGSVWAAYAGSGGSGIGIVKFHNSTWVHYTSSNSGLPNNDVRAMAADNNGNMWIACYNAGLAKFDGTNWTIYNTSNSGIVGDIVTAIRIDTDNTLWAAAYAVGVSKFNGTTWTNYTSANAPFQAFSCINDIVIDASHNLWVGFECSKQLAKLDQAGNWTTYTTLNSGLEWYIRSMIEDNSGNLWIGYVNRDKVSRFDGNTWTTYSPFISPSHSVGYDGFALDDEGDIWCHTSARLYEFSGGSWSNVVVPQLDGVSLQCINMTSDLQGNIWWGSYLGLWTNDYSVCNLFVGEGIVSQVEGQLVVSDEDATYQWKDCTTNLEIPDSTNREFTPPQTGSYSVDVVTNGCTVTSDCFSFEEIVTGLTSLEESNFQLFPNPATNQVTIDVGKSVGTAIISVVGSNGAIGFERTIVNQRNFTLSTRGFHSGVYFVVVQSGASAPHVKKLIIE